MNKTTLLQLINNKAKKSANLHFVSSGFGDSPYVSNFATLIHQQFNVSYYRIYQHASNPRQNYVAVLSYYNDQFILKCGDVYLEGRMMPETTSKLYRHVIERAKPAKPEQLKKVMEESFNKTPRSVTCKFNQKNYTLAGELCEHIAHFLHELPEGIMDKLYKRYHLQLHGTLVPKGMDPALTRFFNRYAFKKHVLVEGDKGSGKTFHTTEWVRLNKYHHVFIGGHEQFESIDFLGHFIQQKNGELVWKDGALTQAFRAAKNGKKTVLIIDEMLRIPKRELNILVSALSPINKEYVLRTGRALEVSDGIAREEVIRVRETDLWVVGTTNIGTAYAVEEIDDALLDRFKPIRKDTTENDLRNILYNTAEHKGFSIQSVESLMTFYNKVQRLRQSDIIRKIINVRHLNEALLFSESESQIVEIIEDSILLWVERDSDGYPETDQMAALKKLIKKIWGVQ